MAVAAVATLVLLGFLVWFTFGTQRNIRRGNELLRWLQDGLPELGGRTELRRLGSSAVQIDVDEAGPPFASAQVNVMLEHRDVGWLWARARRRGRRDFLILRGTLPGPPRFEIECGNSSGAASTDRLDRLDPGGWVRTRWGDEADESPCIEVAHAHRAGADDVEAMHRAWDELAAACGSVSRLSVRNLAPHIEVHLEPPAADPAAPAKGPASTAALFTAFGSLGRLARRDP
jgi:hypothetical protein